MAEITLIYYKDLPTNKENIFLANLSETNDVDKILFKKNNRHLITNLKIDSDENYIGIDKKDEAIKSSLLDRIKDLVDKKTLRCKIELDNLYRTEVNFQKKTT